MGGVTSMCCSQNEVCECDQSGKSMRKDLLPGAAGSQDDSEGDSPGPAAPAASRLSSGGRGSDEYSVTLDKSQGARLGIDVDHQDGVTLMIESINGGLVEAWNQTHPDRIVRLEDRIVEVNGVRSDVLRLIEECKLNKVLRMRLRRPAATSVFA
mmetsp:Transcript_106136/g.332726  ORF Transcript_106136/g.332726 Transcript_106136/m.332726 type:complete len:154 (+) Transcript_106136:72-533(+)